MEMKESMREMQSTFRWSRINKTTEKKKKKNPHALMHGYREIGERERQTKREMSAHRLVVCCLGLLLLLPSLAEPSRVEYSPPISFSELQYNTRKCLHVLLALSFLSYFSIPRRFWFICAAYNVPDKHIQILRRFSAEETPSEYICICITAQLFSLRRHLSAHALFSLSRIAVRCTFCPDLNAWDVRRGKCHNNKKKIKRQGRPLCCCVHERHRKKRIK